MRDWPARSPAEQLPDFPQPPGLLRDIYADELNTAGQDTSLIALRGSHNNYPVPALRKNRSDVFQVARDAAPVLGCFVKLGGNECDIQGSRRRSVSETQAEAKVVVEVARPGEPSVQHIFEGVGQGSLDLSNWSVIPGLGVEPSLDGLLQNVL